MTISHAKARANGGNAAQSAGPRSPNGRPARRATPRGTGSRPHAWCSRSSSRRRIVTHTAQQQLMPRIPAPPQSTERAAVRVGSPLPNCVPRGIRTPVSDVKSRGPGPLDDGDIALGGEREDAEHTWIRARRKGNARPALVTARSDRRTTGWPSSSSRDVPRSPCVPPRAA